MFSIRPVQLDDASALARVHVETWQAAYRGQIPDDYLNSLDIEQRTARWQRRITEELEERFVFVAEDESGMVVGFATSGPERGSIVEYDAETYALYVLPAYQGYGIGRALLRAAAAELQVRGYVALLIWGLTSNMPARRFYEALGGQVVGHKPIEIGGVLLDEVGYGWPDLRVLVG